MMKMIFFIFLVVCLIIVVLLFCLVDGYVVILVNNFKGYIFDEVGKCISFINMVIEEGKVLVLDV